MISVINKKSVLSIILIIILGSAIGCNQNDKSESYDYPPTVYWNDQSYIVQHISLVNISKEDLDEEIGEISEVLPPEQNPSANGIANEFEVGSLIYRLLDKSEKLAIVIEYKLKYYIAYPVE